MRQIYADNLDTLEIARVGEREATQVRFALASWIEIFGTGGSFELEVERPTDNAPYLVTLSQDAESVIWTVSASDTAILGRGRCQLSYYLGNTLAKTRIWDTRILASLSAPGEPPPDPWESYVEAVHQDAVSAAASAVAAASAAQAAEASAGQAAGYAGAAAASEQHAAESEASASASAQRAAASETAAAQSAHDAQLALQGMVYVTFGMDADGHVLINNGELLGTTSFELISANAAQRAGHLEVDY